MEGKFFDLTICKLLQNNLVHAIGGKILQVG